MVTYIVEKLSYDTPWNDNLLYVETCIPVAKVQVRDMFYELFGEVSDSEGSDMDLENYLVSSPNNNCSDSHLQGMARTKQTAQKQTNEKGTSAGGFPIAFKSPRRSPCFAGYLDSDTSLDTAAHQYDMDTSQGSGSGMVSRSSP